MELLPHKELQQDGVQIFLSSMEELTQKDLHHHNMSNNIFYKGFELMPSCVGVRCSHQRAGGF